jgi:anti-sigma factor RsiW
MSRCREIPTQITFYLDDELEGAERVALEKHLSHCVDCRELFEREKSFIDAVREVGPLHRAAPELRARAEAILNTARPSPAAPARISRRLKKALSPGRACDRGAFDHRRTISLIAAGIIVSMVCVWGVARYRNRARQTPTSDFAMMAVDAHVRHLRGQLKLDIVSGAAEQISGWFSGKLPFGVDLAAHQELPGQSAAYDLEGARVVEYKHAYAGYVSCKMGSHSVSLVVASAAVAQPSGGDEVVSKDIAFHYDSIDGFKVITWSDRGLAYALVSDLEKRGRESCVICHQGPKDQAKAGLGDILDSGTP